MAKWKCNNTACNHQWSEKDPTSCPQCGSTDFEKISNDGIAWPIIAKIVGLIIAVIIIILMLRNCSSDGVSVKTTFKKGIIKVELDLNGFDQKDFNIEILRGGTIYESVNGLKSKTFPPLMPGTYYLNIKYIGKKTGSDIPEIIYDNKGPFLVNTIPILLPDPTIVGLPYNQIGNTLNYSLTIKIGPDSLTNLCEFSLNGNNFVRSNVLTIPSGKYVLIARLIDDNSKLAKDSIILPPISITPPPNVDVQSLLNEISNGNNNSFNHLSSILPTQNIKVTGAGEKIKTLYDLMVDCDSGNRYTVDPKVINNKTTSINARKN